MEIGTRVRIKDTVIIGERAEWRGTITEFYRCSITQKELVNVKLTNGQYCGRVLNFWIGSVEAIKPIKLKKFKAWK